MMYSGMLLTDMTLADHIVAAVICVLAPVLALSSSKIAVEDFKLESKDKIRLYHSNALLLVVFALAVITVWRFPGRNLSSLGFDWPLWSPAVILLLVAVFLFYALDIFFQYGMKTWRAKTLQHRDSALTFVPANGKELIHFVFLAIAAGIGEEIIFRGYLIRYILFWTGASFSGILTACFFASALFAFLHGYQGYRAMIKIFFLALMFSALFVLSQSLVIVMVVHALIDMLSGWLGIYLLREASRQNQPGNETES